MKFLPKLGRWQLILLIAVVVVVAALLVHRSKSSDKTGETGAGKMDAHATQACGDFSNGWSKVKSKSARLSLADKVTASSSKSDNRTIRDRAMAVGRNADTSTEWKSSGDALLDACHDAGFTG